MGDARMELCNHLYKAGGGDENFCLEQLVTVSPLDVGGYEILSQHDHSVLAKVDKVVVAGGRFWPFLYGQTLMKAEKMTKEFKRIEFGARLVAPSNNLFFSPNGDSDNASGVEYRTFCFCREGEVVQTAFGSPPFRTCSGRADGPAMGISNTGFNCRVRDPVLAGKLIEEGIFERCRALEPFSRRPLSDDSLEEHYGPTAWRILKKGCELLSQQHPGFRDQFTLSGPTIEGVGAYPVTDGTLKVILPSQSVGQDNLFVCGDATGTFRGIVAGMCSGYYVGAQLAEAMNPKNEQE